MKLALRGAARFLAATAVVLIGSGFALESLRFSPASILGFRILVALAVVGSAAWFLVRPLLRRVSDDQVALYLEEHEPSLEATIITAMEAEQAGRAHEMSPALVRRWSKPPSSAASRSTTAAHRARADPPLRDGRRHRHGRVARRLRAWPRVSAPGALGAADHLARRRSRGAVSHRGHARQRRPCRAAPIRPSARSCSASRRARRRSSCARARPRPTSACRWRATRTAAVRRHAVRSRRPRRVLRRGGRRALAGLHPEGRRSAVREAARSRVPLPGVHRPGAANRRRRRRHRGAARHQREREGHADDDGQGRPHPARRRHGRGADRQRRWHARAARWPSPSRASIASSSTRRRARRSRRRRSTRSICCPIRRRR